MATKFSISIRSGGNGLHRRSRSVRDEIYRLRLLLALTASVGLMLGLARIPWAADEPRLGLRQTDRTDRVHFDLVPRPERDPTPPEHDPGGGSVPATVVPVEPERSPAERQSPGPSEAAEPPSTGEDRRAAVHADMARMPVLSFAEQQPDILGGLRSLYLRIRYPLAAQRAGIQGLVVLRFIVEVDGSASSIEVARSLHPLCDAAAMEAVRQTTFRPARQNGQPVRVRMNLPIRFLLVDERTGEPIAPDSARAPTDTGTAT